MGAGVIDTHVTMYMCHHLPLLTGVEHLLRNVKDATISTLASDVAAKLRALKGLRARLADVQARQLLRV
jgi:26S proteasome regulatory subunit N8